MTGTERLLLLAGTPAFLGLLVAWKWEFWGGLMTLVGGSAILILTPNRRALPVLGFITTIGAVHLICCLILRRSAEDAPSPA